MSLRVLAGCVLALGATAAPATVLHVAAVDGRAAIERAGVVVELAPGYEVVDADRLVVDDGARLDLALGRHGFLELGPGARLEATRIPFASWADDLRTRVRLSNGFLRVVWKRPATAGNWPLVVDVGDFTLALAGGEYLLQAGGDAPVLCIGDGNAFVDYRAPAGAGVSFSKTVSGPACATLLAGGERTVPTIAIGFDDLVVPRQRRVLAALTSSLPAAAAAPAAPTAKPVALSPAIAEAAPRPAAAGRQWVINLASFPERGTAEAQATRLRVAGYTAEVSEAAVRGATWYRVQLRGFASADLARQTALELAERQGYKDAWVTRQ